jgi:hypothetical protein
MDFIYVRACPNANPEGEPSRSGRTLVRIVSDLWRVSGRAHEAAASLKRDHAIIEAIVAIIGLELAPYGCMVLSY